MHIESIVEECLKQHKGGEIFFDNLDEILRNDNLLITMLIGKVLNFHFDYIIVSGRFGKIFKEHCELHTSNSFNEKIIVVNGGLRNGEIIVPFWNKFDLNNKEIIFLDDSYYLGRTRDVIKNKIKKHKGTLTKTLVFYDGSKNKDETVESFYRYYDHYK